MAYKKEPLASFLVHKNNSALAKSRELFRLLVENNSSIHPFSIITLRAAGFCQSLSRLSWNKGRVTHTPKHGQFRVPNLSHMCVFGLWEEAGELREIPHGHSEDMQKGPQGPGLNPATFLEESWKWDLYIRKKKNEIKAFE